MSVNNLSSKNIIVCSNINIDKYIERFKDFKDKIDLTSSNQPEKFISTMESLWKFLFSISDESIVTSLQSDARLGTIQKYLAEKWHEYISLIEINIAKKFLNNPNSDNNTLSALSEEDYVGVDRELSLLARPLSGCNIAMLGCGPFPETLIEIYKFDKEIKRIIGIDKRPGMLKIANKVVKKILPNAKNIRFESSRADLYDYKNIDIVFLANGLVNKGMILKKIYETGKSSLEILARNPILMGKILYEDLYTLPQLELFTICDVVQASKLSQTLLLKLKDR